MGTTSLKKGNNVDTQVTMIYDSDDKKCHFLTFFAFSVLRGWCLGVVKGADIPQSNSSNIFKALFVHLFTCMSSKLYLSIYIKLDRGQVRAILCGSYVFGYFLQVRHTVIHVRNDQVQFDNNSENVMDGIFAKFVYFLHIILYTYYCSIFFIVWGTPLIHCIS